MGLYYSLMVIGIQNSFYLAYSASFLLRSCSASQRSRYSAILRSNSSAALASSTSFFLRSCSASQRS